MPGTQEALSGCWLPFFSTTRPGLPPETASFRDEAHCPARHLAGSQIQREREARQPSASCLCSEGPSGLLDRRDLHPGRKGHGPRAARRGRYLSRGPEAASPARACSAVGPMSRCRCRAWGSECGVCLAPRTSHRPPGRRWGRPVSTTVTVILSNIITNDGATTLYVLTNRLSASYHD